MKQQNLDIFNSLYSGTEIYYGGCLRRELSDYVETNNLFGKAILDLGCGEGRISLYLAERGSIVTAIDASEVGLSKLLRSAQERRLPIATLQQSLQNFTFPARQFDVVIAATILDHLPDNERPVVIRGIKHALKAGGIVYANVFTIFDPGHLAKASAEIAKINADISETAICIEHYFEPNELLKQFLDFNILYYYEGIESDFSHGAPHRHGWASVIAQKPSHQPTIRAG